MYDYIKNKLLEENLYNPNKEKVSPWLERKISADLKKRILEETNFLKIDLTLSDRINTIMLGITSQPRCLVCNKPTNYHRSIKKFADTCNNKKCISDKTLTKRENTKQKLYGGHFAYISEKDRKKNASLGGKAVAKFYRENYGVSNCMQLYHVKEKHHRNIRRGSRESFEIGKAYSQKHFSKDQIDILNNLDTIYQEHIEDQIPITVLSEKYGFSTSYLHNKMKELGYDLKIFGGSYLQKDFAKDIKNLGLHIEENYRRAIPPKELDIYVPYNNLGIEINGMFWHSTVNLKPDRYHFDKWKGCKDKGIKLIQFTEEELYFKRDVCLSIIKANTGLCRRVFARNCQIQKIGIQDYRDFCDKNHIQGYTPAEIKLGLFYENELISIMSFSKSRFNKNIEYEIVRSAHAINTTVVGGTSKLFSYFIRMFKPKSVITYSDNRLFSGNSYEKCGFVYSHTTPISYRYVKDGKAYSRFKFQKHKLSNILDKYNPELTEKENMINNGFRIMYDCGNQAFVYSNI